MGNLVLVIRKRNLVVRPQESEVQQTITDAGVVLAEGAVIEDGDFGYSVKKCGGKIFYHPDPRIIHLRIPTGGVRQKHRSKGMFYRAHNTVYFFRKQIVFH